MKYVNELPDEVIDEIVRQIDESPIGYSPLEAILEFEENEEDDFLE